MKIRWLSIPYVLIRFFEIAVFFTIHVTCMVMMKKEWNLGVLIAACCIGGFILLFLLYLWAVTFSMFQMIGVVSNKDYQMRLIQETTPNTQKNFKKSQVSGISQATNFRYPNEMLSRDFSELYRKNHLRI